MNIQISVKGDFIIKDSQILSFHFKTTSEDQILIYCRELYWNVLLFRAFIHAGKKNNIVGNLFVRRTIRECFLDDLYELKADFAPCLRTTLACLFFLLL